MIVRRPTGCWGMGLNIGRFWLVSQSYIILDDTFYSEILSFYTASEYRYPAYIYNTPLNQRPDVKSKFRQSVKPYKVEDGIVMHGKEQVLTKKNLHGVLKACHDNPVFGGHFARDKTNKKKSQQYYWKGMLTFSVLLISMFFNNRCRVGVRCSDAFMERGGGLPVKTAFQCSFIAVAATNNSDSEKYSKRRSRRGSV